MHFGEAFGRLGALSPVEQKEVLADQSADGILRSAAALLIAKNRSLISDTRVAWLLESWDFAPLDVKEYILEGLAHCPSAAGISFLKSKLVDSDLRLAAVNSLAIIGNEEILPVCQELIRSGTERDCHSAAKALSTLGTDEAIMVVESLLQSSPSEWCRYWAAHSLALKGISTGELLLENHLESLQPLRAEHEDGASHDRLGIEPKYLLNVLALCQINNRRGLLALEQVLDILHADQNVSRDYPMFMTRGLAGLSTTTSFEEWTVAMRHWIAERLRVQRPGR